MIIALEQGWGTYLLKEA